jgi:hypothetical protein
MDVPSIDSTFDAVSWRNIGRLAGTSEGRSMSSLYRLVDPHGELVADADTIDYLKGILGDLPPGRYRVDEISVTPLPSGHTARRWGIILRLADGRIIEEPDAWES